MLPKKISGKEQLKLVTKNNDLDYALELMSKHNALNDTLNDAVFWSNKAKESIIILPKSPLRDVLLELPDYVVSRLS